MKRVIAILVCQLIIISVSVVRGENERFGRSLDRKPNLNWLKKEKLSHFRFYWHDINSGSHPTSIRIVESPMNSSLGFGFVNMMDDPLTEGPELSSKLLGKAQGLFGNADQESLALVMVMNFAFVEGKYNGSSFSIVGRNSILLDVREMAVVGGTGLFRFARGYVQASTYSYSTSGDAVVEYNAYVLHYDF